MKRIYSFYILGIMTLSLHSVLGQTGPWARYDSKMKGEALISKADGGYLDDIKSIVQGGGDVNWQLDIYKTTPLMAAASAGHTDVVLFLLSSGADPALKNNNGQTAADRAFQSGATDIVKIIRHFELTGKLPSTQPGKTATGPWARYNPKMKGEALISRASGGNSVEIKLILDGGGDVNWQTTAGYTPLLAAIDGGHVEVVKLLLAHGANPGLKDQYGKTALDKARQKGNQAIINLLGGKSVAPGPETKPASQPQKNQSTLPGTTSGSVTASSPGGSSAIWPPQGTYTVGEPIIYFAGSWKRGIIKEVGIAYEPSHKTAHYSENKYKIAHDANPNWPDWVDWSQVVKPAREPFWVNWFVGTWALGEVMAVNTRTDGVNVYNEVGYLGASETLQVNANGTYTWKPLSHPVVSGNWIPASDGPGIVLQKGYKNLDWTLRNESSAVELIIRKMEKARLYPPNNTQISISGKRLFTGKK